MPPRLKSQFIFYLEATRHCCCIFPFLCCFYFFIVALLLTRSLPFRNKWLWKRSETCVKTLGTRHTKRKNGNKYSNKKNITLSISSRFNNIQRHAKRQLSNNSLRNVWFRTEDSDVPCFQFNNFVILCCKHDRLRLCVQSLHLYLLKTAMSVKQVVQHSYLQLRAHLLPYVKVQMNVYGHKLCWLLRKFYQNCI